MQEGLLAPCRLNRWVRGVPATPRRCRRLSILAPRPACSASLAAASSAAATSPSTPGAPPPGAQGRPGRLECEHFGSCSGCSLPDDDPPLADKARKYFLACSGGLLDVPPLFTGPPTGWRTRAKLAVRRGIGGGARVGLFGEGSHSVVDIPACAAHHPLINEAVKMLKAELGTTEPYWEPPPTPPQAASSRKGRRTPSPPAAMLARTGELRYLLLTVVPQGPASSPPAAAAPPGGPLVQLTLVWNAPSASSKGADRALALADRLWRAGGSGVSVSGGSDAPSLSPPPLFHSIWVNWHAAPSNAVLNAADGAWTLAAGAEDLVDWPAGPSGPAVSYSPASFGQANAGQYAALIAALAAWVPRGSRVLELYAGVGAIGLSLVSSGLAASLRCVEVVAAAAAPFRRSRERLAPAARAAVADLRIASAGDVPGSVLADADVVIVDPPRRGLDAALLSALCALGEGAAAGEPRSRPPPGDEGAGAPGGGPARARASPTGPSGGGSGGPGGPSAAPTPRRLIYVSCGFPAFQRDCDALLGSGRWRLAFGQLFSFFPGTDSLETLAVFDRVA